MARMLERERGRPGVPQSPARAPPMTEDLSPPFSQEHRAGVKCLNKWVFGDIPGPNSSSPLPPCRCLTFSPRALLRNPHFTGLPCACHNTLFFFILFLFICLWAALGTKSRASHAEPHPQPFSKVLILRQGPLSAEVGLEPGSSCLGLPVTGRTAAPRAWQVLIHLRGPPAFSPWPICFQFTSVHSQRMLGNSLPP